MTEKFPTSTTYNSLDGWHASEQRTWELPDERKEVLRQRRIERIAEEATRLAARFDTADGRRKTYSPPPPDVSPVATETNEAPLSSAPEELYEPFDRTDAEYMLSYADVAADPESSVEFVRTDDNAIAYVDELILLSEKYGQDEVTKLSDMIRQRYAQDAAKIGLETSKFGKSVTWSMWDIAKQSYLAKHPEESSEQYKLADPFDPKHQDEKIAEISNRHLGWEFSEQFNHDPNVLEKAPDATRKKIEDLLRTAPRNHLGLLPSWQLARLGKWLARDTKDASA